MSFCVPYRGKPYFNGNQDAPAGVMARGLAVVRSTVTIAKAGVGVRPYGFLNSEVTLTGETFEDRTMLPQNYPKKVKVSDGKVQIVALQDGVEYIFDGITKSGTTFAVGEYVVVAADGELTDEAGGASGNLRIGRVQEIDIVHEGQTGCVVFKAESDLGNVA